MLDYPDFRQKPTAAALLDRFPKTRLVSEPVPCGEDGSICRKQAQLIDDGNREYKRMAADGLTTVASNYGAKETMDRLQAEVRARGLTLFARIDHAAGAEEVGLPLRPTELLIFGNARGGTPLMQSNQTIGIDLPLKALVWQDASGKTWLSYNDPSWLASRHGLSDGLDSTINAMAAALSAIAAKVTASS